MKIELQNITPSSGYDSNLILLGQLQENRSTYYDNPITMTLRRKDKVITYVKRNQNFFILNLALLGQVMLVRSKAMSISR